MPRLDLVPLPRVRHADREDAVVAGDQPDRGFGGREHDLALEHVEGLLEGVHVRGDDAPGFEP